MHCPSVFVMGVSVCGGVDWPHKSTHKHKQILSDKYSVVTEEMPHTIYETGRTKVENFQNKDNNLSRFIFRNWHPMYMYLCCKKNSSCRYLNSILKLKMGHFFGIDKKLLFLPAVPDSDDLLGVANVCVWCVCVCVSVCVQCVCCV